MGEKETLVRKLYDVRPQMQLLIGAVLVVLVK